MANEFFSNEHTQVLQKLIKEIVNDPSTYYGSKLMPSVAVPARRIRTEVVEASGGLTNEHAVGTDPEYIRDFGTRVQEFQAPAYKETILYDEEKILWLRELGQNDMSKRGIRKYIDVSVDRLNRRLEARMEYLRWQAVINGGFTYLGNTISYGIPAGNRVVPVGALWSLDGINANNLADPVKDIRYWLLGGTAGYRKYVITKMIMNPNTARWILDNSNVQTLVKSYFSAENFGSYELNKTLQMLIPGAPPAEVYKGWYQSESIVSNKLVVGDAQFFLPDGYIYFECSLPGGDAIGEFVQGVHLASGSMEEPGVGKFLVVEECIAPGTRGGPKNPFVEITAGVYGGVKLDRPFDVLTAKVIA